ncbi:phosphotransferase [Salinicola avicenniae]|uniref:phosphotransferase n=1 Tax=Salinicola avicenniae TaxID=2916836 RepID=UPI002073C89E|nr:MULTISPECIES: phosphotransferase [unclassified Salinicola]
MTTPPERDTASVLEAPALSVSTETAQRLLTTRFGLDAALKPLTGERDRNFRATTADGQTYLLKFTHPAERQAVSDFQVRALMHLAERDPTLPIPRVLRDRDGDPAPPLRLDDGRVSRVRLSTFLPGEPLADRVAAPAFQATLGDWLARLDAALADFDHPVRALSMPWDLQRADDLLPQTESLTDDTTRETVRRVLQRFAEELRPRLATLPRQPIHNDLNGHNVLFAAAPESRDAPPERPAAIIDFGDMLFAPRIVDLAVAAAYQMKAQDDPMTGALALIAGYHARTPLEATEVALLRGLIETRLAMAITVSTHRAKRYPENADYLLRNTAASWRALHYCTALPESTFQHRLAGALNGLPTGTGTGKTQP